MKTVRAMAALAPRLATARSFSAGQRLTVSMKESYTSAQDKGVVPSTEGYDRIRQIQSDWSQPSETMVWQKRGTTDSMPYYFTSVACAIGTGICFWMIWTMSWPKKQD